MKSLIRAIATVGPVGYLPAPGTMGTLAALPLAYALSCLQIGIGYKWLILCGAIVAAVIICDYAARMFRMHDPKQIVLDEVVGLFVTLCGVTWNYKSVILGFILFRFFDILKPLGLRSLESLSGGLGIVLDDVIAGGISAILLRLLLLYV